MRTNASRKVLRIMGDEVSMHIPEHSLLAAILERAIRDVTRCDMNSSYFYEDSIEPFTFRWICEQLSDDAEGLASRVLTLIRERRAPRQRACYIVRHTKLPKKPAKRPNA
jgi:hypothetical protein